MVRTTRERGSVENLAIAAMEARITSLETQVAAKTSRSTNSTTCWPKPLLTPPWWRFGGSKFRPNRGRGSNPQSPIQSKYQGPFSPSPPTQYSSTTIGISQGQRSNQRTLAPPWRCHKRPTSGKRQSYGTRHPTGPPSFAKPGF